MAQRGGSVRTLGLALAFLGTFTVSLGLARAPFLPVVAGLEGWVVATMEGFILLLAGILIVLFAPRPVVETAGDITPATVAFATRNVQPLPVPERRAAPAPAPRAAPTMDPRALALFRLDEEIRDLTRRINKAGVLLATGQLSDEGYAHYVEDLKRQRAQLEASRVRLELGQRPR